MTQKQIENAFLEEECTWCEGSGMVMQGGPGEEVEIPCICKSLDMAEKEAEGLEESNIVGE